MRSAPGDTRQRILLLLKRRGPLSADALAKRLQITGAGVRLQLQKMRDEGLVSSEQVRRPRGRPAGLWSATPAAASASFSDGYGELSLQLLDGVVQRWGRRGLVALLQPVADAQVSRATTRQLPEEASGRLTALARQRRAEGYLTEVRRTADGSAEVLECHCVVGAAARAFPDICAAELRALKSLVGPDYSITRTEHAAAGAPRCVYRVTRRP